MPIILVFIALLKRTRGTCISKVIHLQHGTGLILLFSLKVTEARTLASICTCAETQAVGVLHYYK